MEFSLNCNRNRNEKGLSMNSPLEIQINLCRSQSSSFKFRGWHPWVFSPCDFNQKFHFQSGLADVPLEDRIGCCVDSLLLDSSGFLQRQLHTCFVAPLLVECCWSLMPNAAGGMPFKKLYLREDTPPSPPKNKKCQKEKFWGSSKCQISAFVCLRLAVVWILFYIRPESF